MTSDNAPMLAADARIPSGNARIGDFLNRALQVPILTIETPYACSPKRVFTRSGYQQAGRRIAEAVMSVCR